MQCSITVGVADIRVGSRCQQPQGDPQKTTPDRRNERLLVAFGCGCAGAMREQLLHHGLITLQRRPI